MEIDKARKHFRNMPDEVFNLWLHDIIKERGWPFLKENEETLGTNYENLFNRLSLSYWTNLHWRIEIIPYDELVLDDISLQKAQAIIDEVILGESVFTTKIENMAERYESCVSFVEENNCFPKPIICQFNLDKSLTVVDGHHRLAALKTFRNIDKFPFWTWIGYPS